MRGHSQATRSCFIRRQRSTRRTQLRRVVQFVWGIIKVGICWDYFLIVDICFISNALTLGWGCTPHVQFAERLRSQRLSQLLWPRWFPCQPEGILNESTLVVFNVQSMWYLVHTNLAHSKTLEGPMYMVQVVEFFIAYWTLLPWEDLFTNEVTSFSVFGLYVFWYNFILQ